jgi:hypothetical protein
VRDAGLGRGGGADDAEGVRGGEILHLADHRRLDALGAEEVDRLLREVAGALGRDQDQRASAVGHEARCNKRNGHPRTQDIRDGNEDFAFAPRLAQRYIGRLSLKYICKATTAKSSKDQSHPRRDSTPGRVQLKNPITNRWVKLDTKTGRIIDTKKSPGPYKNIPRK